MPRRGRPPSPDILTPREAEVVGLVAQGMTNAAIAEQLGISEQGAKYHLNQVYAKLELGSREELIAWAKSHRKRRIPAFAAPVAKIGALFGAGAVGALVITAIVTGGTKQSAPPPAASPSPQLTVVGSLSAKVVCIGESADGAKGTQLYTASLPGGVLTSVGSTRFYDSIMLTADGEQARISASQQHVLVNLADSGISSLPRAAIGLDGYPPGTWSPDGHYQATVGLPMYIFNRAGDVVAEADYGSRIYPGTPPSGDVQYGGGFVWSADSSTYGTIQSGFLVLLSTDGHSSVTDITKTLGLDESLASTPMGFVGTYGPNALVVQLTGSSRRWAIVFQNGKLVSQEIADNVPLGQPLDLYAAASRAFDAAVTAARVNIGPQLNLLWKKTVANSDSATLAALQTPGGAVFVLATPDQWVIFSSPECDPSGNEDLIDAVIPSP